jgi:hypothetical protein
MAEQDRQQANKYAREVLAGSQVVIGQRPATSAASPLSAPRQAVVVGTGLSAPRVMFVLCLGMLAAIGLVVYAVSGFGTASVIFFILSLVLMAAWFVF